VRDRRREKHQGVGRRGKKKQGECDKKEAFQRGGEKKGRPKKRRRKSFASGKEKRKEASKQNEIGKTANGIGKEGRRKKKSGRGKKKRVCQKRKEKYFSDLKRGGGVFKGENLRGSH